ncbi:MAG: aldehyde ferredoxin oxidoreductase family protein [Spirochaetes bacterium]|nr:aldehyde ferredoxin oxidoreductase family protein [Spirochaetota bacterium]
MKEFKGAYMGKILRVDLTKKASRTEDLKGEDLKLLLGGRGLGAKIYYDEIGPDVDPFDERNKVIFMTGPLTGVRLPSTTKFQLATKSPETGRYLCSNCGGDFGPQLKRAGYDGLIVEGSSDDWTSIIIKDGDVSFIDASSWKGFNSDITLQRLKDSIGDARAGCMSIGPAAERLVRISFINVDNRAFGRGGAGGVLGAKRLKGIAVKGSGRVPVADPERVNQIWKEAVKDLRTSRANHTKYGTPQYIEAINEFGCMPTRNFQTTFFERIEGVDAHTMKKRYYVKNFHCFNCPVGCGMVCEVKEGPFAGARARTEYETVALLGPNCGVDDFGAIVAGNQLCDEMGIDTMSGGNLVGLTMELFERGLITKEHTDGIEAKFGSGEAMVGLLRLIAERRGIGDLLAEGARGVMKKHPEWAPYIMAVKGLPYAAYDPRGFYGNALTYGTSSRGACHNVGGWTIRAELQSGDYDRWALEGKGKLVKQIQDNRAYVDSLGICTVVRGSMDFRDHPASDVMEAVTGYGFTPDLMNIGTRIYNLERLILSREGVKRKDDQLPPRTVNEKVPSGPSKGKFLTREMYNLMLDEYYEERGWDSDGVPKEETVKRLKLHTLLS